MISYMISWFWRTYQGYQEAWSFMFHVHDIIIQYHSLHDIIYDIMLLGHDIIVWHTNVISYFPMISWAIWYHTFIWNHTMISLCDLNCLGIRWTRQTSRRLACTGGRYVHGASWFSGRWWRRRPQSAGSSRRRWSWLRCRSSSRGTGPVGWRSLRISTACQVLI